MEKFYIKNLEELIGRQLSEKDGLTEDSIKKYEKDQGVILPKSMRDYFLIAGSLKLNKRHNRLYDLNEIFIDQDFFVFMEENQRVAFWGVKINDLSMADPIVYQGVNSKPMEWYSEDLTFSHFIIKMWQWQSQSGL